MTLSDALKVARRWWWILVLGPIVGALVAYLISQALTPIYEATTIILVQQSATPGTQNYQDLLAAQQQASTYSRLVSSGPVLDEAANQIGIVGGGDSIKKHLSVSLIQGTQLLSVSVSDPIPSRAAEIANTVAAVFIDQNEQQLSNVTGSGLQEIQQNLDQAKNQIDETTAQIAQLEATPVTGTVEQTRITSLKQQLSEFQATYGTLLEAQQRMSIAQTQVGAQTRVVDPAKPPKSPIRPRVTLNVALGGMLSLLLATGIVGLVGYYDNTIKTSEDLRRLIGAGALGSIPTTANFGTKTILMHPRSAASEGFRALRTNLQFAMANHHIKVITITSIRPGDGKSTTAASLALVLAQAGQRVVLVDADLRKPRQHRLFSGLNNTSGLTNLLRGSKIDQVDILQQTEIASLRVLTSGPLPANPSDSLDSPRMREVFPI